MGVLFGEPLKSATAAHGAISCSRALKMDSKTSSSGCCDPVAKCCLQASCCTETEKCCPSNVCCTNKVDYNCQGGTHCCSQANCCEQASCAGCPAAARDVPCCEAV